MSIILFNHIPKTGGRSIARHFKNNLRQFHMSGNHLDLTFNSTRHNLQKDNIRFDVEGNFIFTIIRHPYERYVSAINHLHTFEETKNVLIKKLGESKKHIKFDLDFILNVEDVRNTHLIFRDQIKHIKLINHDLIHRYDKPLNEIVKIVNDIYKIKFPLEVDNFNVSKHVFNVSDLTTDQKKKIESLYKKDFEVYDEPLMFTNRKK